MALGSLNKSVDLVLSGGIGSNSQPSVSVAVSLKIKFESRDKCVAAEDD